MHLIKFLYFEINDAAQDPVQIVARAALCFDNHTVSSMLKTLTFIGLYL